MGLSYNPKIDDKYLSLLEKLNTQDYLYFFDSCFNNLKLSQKIFILNKDGIELRCEYKNKNALSVYFKSREELYISGDLLRE